MAVGPGGKDIVMLVSWNDLAKGRGIPVDFSEKQKIRIQVSQLSQVKTNKWDSCVQYMNGATCMWVWTVNVITSGTLETKKCYKQK